MRILDNEIALGSRHKIMVPVASLFDYTKLAMPVEVIRGRRPGPTLFVSAAIHGDEVIGVEIIKRLLADKGLNDIAGTLITISIVNPFGYNNTSRYLPDRRDLNRCFPGAVSGSLAARVAHALITEVVDKCEYGIDIHSGAIHRFNTPQIRISKAEDEEWRLARSFGAPVILESEPRDGTLRKSAKERGLKTLLYEAGEALRFDEDSIIIGVRGVLNVMSALDMIAFRSMPDGPAPIIAKDSHWIRAPQSGSLRVLKEHGAWVAENELLGVITDPYGGQSAEVRSRSAGWIIASVTMPLVNLGNALFHIATTDCIRQDGTDTCFFPNVVRDQDVDIENEGW